MYIYTKSLTMYLEMAGIMLPQEASRMLPLQALNDK
jgi:hypothetical protein